MAASKQPMLAATLDRLGDWSADVPPANAATMRPLPRRPLVAEYDSDVSNSMSPDAARWSRSSTLRPSTSFSPDDDDVAWVMRNSANGRFMDVQRRQILDGQPAQPPNNQHSHRVAAAVANAAAPLSAVARPFSASLLSRRSAGDALRRSSLQRSQRAWPANDILAPPTPPAVEPYSAAGSGPSSARAIAPSPLASASSDGPSPADAVVVMRPCAAVTPRSVAFNTADTPPMPGLLQPQSTPAQSQQHSMLLRSAERESEVASGRLSWAPAREPALRLTLTSDSHDPPSPSLPPHPRDAPPEGVTFYHPDGPDLPARPRGDGPIYRPKRRPNAPAGPRVPCGVQPGPPPRRFSGKGALHANRCAGPWASALDPERMPQLPLTGAKRARAGLAEVQTTHAEERSIKAERAARALVALLPFGAAPFILHDTPEGVRARAPEDTAERLVHKLRTVGVSSLNGASSILGRLMHWMRQHRPSSTQVLGPDVSDFFADHPPSAAATDGLTWLSDWCGLDLPARGLAARPPPLEGGAPRSVQPRDDLAMSVAVQFGLQVIAAGHPSEFVAGHAAGWAFIALAALRLEQASACVINAVVSHVYRGTTVRIAVGSVLRDKNPNAANQKPRPFWCAVDGVFEQDAILRPLLRMLDGAEGIRAILRDTDSRSGDPADAHGWLMTHLPFPARAEASLHSLLRMHPICMPPAMAKRHHGHFAKRFLLNLVDDSPEFNTIEANEVGRFTGSTAQNTDLIPLESMLRAHEARVAVLPARYAAKRKVAIALDLVARIHLVLRRTTAAFPSLASLAWSPDTVDWGEAGPVVRSREQDSL